jgi:hypothetical protein
MKRLLLLFAGILLASCVAAQTQPSSATPSSSQTPSKTREVNVPGSVQWTDTGVDVGAGQTITISATGTLQFNDGASAGPQGAARGWRDLLRSMPVNAAGRGALIGRIGSDDAAEPFLVGAELTLKVRVAGRLFLGFNGTSSDTAQGNFRAKIEVSGGAAAASSGGAATSGSGASASSAASPAASSAGDANSGAGASLSNVSAGGAASSSAPSATSTSAAGTSASGASSASTSTSSAASDAAMAAQLPKDLFTEIPRRVADKDGDPGDMVNFLLIGSEDQVKAAFAVAGWVLVDRDVKDAVVEGLIASLSHQAYVTMPMSQLYLFGRPQDYGFAHAEPIKVVMTRHHLRVWKSTRTVGGQPVWVGAATHDMGLEKDQRNGKLTHHIDPNVDDERGFVERSLSESGYVAQHTRVLPANPVQDAKTATGGGFHSNGEVLVMWLSAN